MTDHPYKKAEDRAFWSRSVTTSFDPASVVDDGSVRLGRDDTFMSAGSCFASNIRRYLELWGYRYTVAERSHPQWPESKEALYYEAFSARYGNIYTARQMAQLLQRATGTLHPAEEYWESTDGTLIDPYRPGLTHRASSLPEFRALTEQHLRAVRGAVERSTVLVFTLGLTEAWLSADDGCVFPACPGTVAGEFDPVLHQFVEFSVDDVVEDLQRMVETLRSINRTIRIILTVSPVPLVATASGRHVLTATTYSKSVLRVAADQVARRDVGVDYFPAYEIVTGPQGLGTSFESDLRTVREPVIASVMSAFAAAFLPSDSQPKREVPSEPRRDTDDQIVQAFEAECEEMMADEELSSKSGARPPDLRSRWAQLRPLMRRK